MRQRCKKVLDELQVALKKDPQAQAQMGELLEELKRKFTSGSLRSDVIDLLPHLYERIKSLVRSLQIFQISISIVDDVERTAGILIEDTVDFVRTMKREPELTQKLNEMADLLEGP